MDHGADIYIFDKYNYNALCYSAQEGHLSIVEFLVKKASYMKSELLNVVHLNLYGRPYVVQLNMVIFVLSNS